MLLVVYISYYIIVNYFVSVFLAKAQNKNNNIPILDR